MQVVGKYVLSKIMYVFL